MVPPAVVEAPHDMTRWSSGHTCQPLAHTRPSPARGDGGVEGRWIWPSGLVVLSQPVLSKNESAGMTALS